MIPERAHKTIDLYLNGLVAATCATIDRLIIQFITTENSIIRRTSTINTLTH